MKHLPSEPKKDPPTKHKRKYIDPPNHPDFTFAYSIPTPGFTQNETESVAFDPNLMPAQSVVDNSIASETAIEGLYATSSPIAIELDQIYTGFATINHKIFNSQNPISLFGVSNNS